MRKRTLFNSSWHFTAADGSCHQVTLPHTWNGADGQDGGNDYFRGLCHYEKAFPRPDFQPDSQRVYLEFLGVNASAQVILNGHNLTTHHGGYTTFRCDITDHLADNNRLSLSVDNGNSTEVYPQKADFTFYGGIYRDIYLITVNKHHFDLDYYGSPGIAITAQPQGDAGLVHIRTWHNCEAATVQLQLTDMDGNTVASGIGTDATLTIPGVRLWQGLEDPYLYNCIATLTVDEEAVDTISTQFGVRSFQFDPQKGFFLNGRSYPLRGVSRHQDRPELGNALQPTHHREDLDLIREVGANAIRLAHYPHDPYFYDLCDRAGMVVWAEIPYISQHMPQGRENTLAQLREMIVQNYNHPCIITWGISNEITISTRDKRDMLSNHHALNRLAHSLDPLRPTVLACYAMCIPFHKVAHITDLVGWNLYLGWYVPGLFLNKWWIDFFHRIYPDRCLGFSEYGCEGMPNLHSSQPRRGDHSEEYQALYHEYMLSCFRDRPFMWGNFVWNMFDFAADARNQGGEPGRNHKGLVTFDRKLRKDSFYLYKAYWNPEPMVHIAGKRYLNRPEAVTTVKVYTNQNRVSLYANGELIGVCSDKQPGGKVFCFRVPLKGTVQLEAVSGQLRDSAEIYRAAKPDPTYRLSRKKAGGGNWT